MDEGYTVNAVMSAVETGSTILDSGQYYSCPTYCYPTALLVAKLGDSPANYRLLATLSGIVFIGAIFFITRKLFTTNIALLTSFFITFSYWHIAWSRQARWYTLFVLFFWLANYFFYKLDNRDENKYKNALLAITFTIATIFTHGLGYLLPLIFIIWTIVNKIIFKKNLTKKSLGLLTLLGILIITIVEYQIGIISNLSLHYELTYYLNFYLRSYWLFIILGLFGYFSLYQSYKKPYLFLFTILITYLIPISFFTNVVHYRYLFHITPIIFIFGSIGLIALYKDIKPLWGRTLLIATTLTLFATIGGGVFTPRTQYFLESDNAETLSERPHYAYTPQPNWNAAYSLISANKTSDDIIISSHPHFNKIFLHEAGYWIKFNYLGFDQRNEYNNNDKEFYVNAKIIDDLLEFKNTTNNTHGFVIYDFMATDNRIPDNILSYIETNFQLVFHEKTNTTSEIWVYQF
jgi:hypothetical protein